MAMDDIIRKIVEVEKVCSEDLENAALESRRKIDTLKYELENKRAQAEAEILESNKKRYKSLVEDANEQVKSELNEIHKETDLLIQDRELCEAIKERIVTIVLGT
jgi:F0F1-type ATP synthase membrane subunit b/b'